MNRVIGVGDCAVSTDPAESIATYALGSCIGVAVHDPVATVGGVLHYLLPESGLDAERARANPFVFADSGVPELVRLCVEAGAEKRRMIVRAAGGASVVKDRGIFSIGEKNHLSLRKALLKAGLMLHSERTGGGTARSLRLEIGTGDLWIKEGSQPAWILFNNAGVFPA